MWNRGVIFGALLVALAALVSVGGGRAQAQDVLTVTETGGQVASVVFEWTSDGSGDAVGRTAAVIPGILFAASTQPGTGAEEPSAAYDVVVYQVFSTLGGGTAVIEVDLAEGDLADLSAVAPTYHGMWPSEVRPLAGMIQIEVSGAGAANEGRVELAVARHLALQTHELSLVGGTAGQVLQYSAPGLTKYVSLSGDGSLADGGAFSLAPGAISSRTGVTPVSGDYVLLWDATDSALKKVNASEFLGGGGGGAVDSVNGATGVVVLDADDIDDTSTTHKFVTAADVTKLGNLSGTNTGDQTITLTGDVTGSGTGSFAATVANDAVTNAKAANMAESTLKGRASGAGTGDPTDLTATQVRTILNVEDGATADQSDAEIETAYNNQVSVVGQAEAEAGSATTVRRWTAQRVGQAVAALAPGVTLAGTPDYLTLAGQVITRGLIDLGTDVTGDLPYANLTQIAQYRILGRVSSGTGDVEELTWEQIEDQRETFQALTSTSNAVAWSSANGRKFAHVLTENTTIGADSGTPVDGEQVWFRVQKKSTYTLSWNAQFRAGETYSDTIPVLSTVADDFDHYGWAYNSTDSVYDLVAYVKGN